MTPVARSRGKVGSAVESGSRGVCALRAGSATSGSTSTCGTTGRPAERCTGRHRGKKRNSRARGQAGRGSRSRGHRRTSGGGEVAGRGLGRRHGHPSPGRRAVAGGPRLQVHLAGLAQDGRGNWRSDAQASGAVQGVRAHNGQRQGVRGPQGGCRDTRRSSSRSRTGTRPERATGWFVNISRRRPIFASWTPPNRVEDLLNNRPRKALGLPDSRGSFQTGVDRGPAPLKRSPARGAVGVRAHSRRLPDNRAGAAASRAGSRAGVAGHGQTTCRPDETGRRPGGDFSPRQGP